MNRPHHPCVRYLLAFGLCSLAACARGDAPAPVRPSLDVYHANILELARANDAYRRVVFTGAKTQLVVMSIPPGGDVGQESHEFVEQFLFCAGGVGQVLIDGKSSPFRPGDVVVVPPGTRHNFLNTGAAPLQIYTIYAPPNHLPGRVHATKADAEADVEDHEFGHRVEAGGSDVEP
jgi:mannose-6-phosphate isomerase-like protein (cupin superfamily)